jgi:hypothetical protein
MIENLKDLKRNEKLAIRKVGEQFYIVCGHDCYEVNNIGATITNVMGSDISINDLCEKLSTKYEYKDIVKIQEDVSTFINFLLEEGLVTNE